MPLSVCFFFAFVGILVLACLSEAQESLNTQLVKFEGANCPPGATYEGCDLLYLCIHDGAHVQGQWSYWGLLYGNYEENSGYPSSMLDIVYWELGTFNSPQGTAFEGTMNISFDGNEATLTADNSLFPITDRETSNLSGAVIASPTADELRRRCMFGRSLDDDPNLQGWYEDSSGNTGIVCHDESDVRSSYRHVYLEDQPLVGAAMGDVEKGHSKEAQHLTVAGDLPDGLSPAFRSTWESTEGPMCPLTGWEARKLDTEDGTAVSTVMRCLVDNSEDPFSPFQGNRTLCQTWIEKRLFTSVTTSPPSWCKVFPNQGITTMTFQRDTSTCPENWEEEYPLCGLAFHYVNHGNGIVQGSLGGNIMFQGNHHRSGHTSVLWVAANGKTGSATWHYSSDFTDILNEIGFPEGEANMGFGVTGADMMRDIALGRRLHTGQIAGKWLGPLSELNICQDNTTGVFASYNKTFLFDDGQHHQGDFQTGVMHGETFDSGGGIQLIWRATAGTEFLPEEPANGSAIYRVNYENPQSPILVGFQCEYREDDYEFSQPPKRCERFYYSSENTVPSTAACNSFPKPPIPSEPSRKSDDDTGFSEAAGTGVSIIAALFGVLAATFIILYCNEKRKKKYFPATSKSTKAVAYTPVETA